MYQIVASDTPLNQDRATLPCRSIGSGVTTRHWYAVYTYPQHEKVCAKQLMERGVDAFLPTFTQERLWKNRQRVKVQLPLFPSYLFVCVDHRERSKVMAVPGALRILGNSSGPQPIPGAVIDMLR